MWIIFKAFTEFVTTLLLFHVLFWFDCKACGTSAPKPRIEPVPPALEGKVCFFFFFFIFLKFYFIFKFYIIVLEGKVLTTGLLGKSQDHNSWFTW